MDFFRFERMEKIKDIFFSFKDAMDAKDAARELDGGKVAGHRYKLLKLWFLVIS